MKLLKTSIISRIKPNVVATMVTEVMNMNEQKKGIQVKEEAPVTKREHPTQQYHPKDGGH